MKYPEELVHKYGAKAGMLLYVNDHLPEIPQKEMVIGTPDKSAFDIMFEAEEKEFGWPRIVRSSAVAELDGYEGWFPTRIVDGPYTNRKSELGIPIPDRNEFQSFRELEYVINEVQISPLDIKKDEPGKHDHIPDNITAILAEKSNSSLTGTYIKHPTEEDFFILSAIVPETINSHCPRHQEYTFRPNEGVKEFKRYSNDIWNIKADTSDSCDMLKEFEEVISWYEKIVELPDIDSDWTYQIEFGIDPVCLFQVRPFRKIQKPDFKVEPSDDNEELPLVIGATSEEGIDVRAETNIWKRHCKQEEINSEGIPSLFYGKLREANSFEYVPNAQVSILYESMGLLAHEDISTIRQSQVSILYYFLMNDKVQQGKTYNIRSDGINIAIKEK